MSTNTAGLSSVGGFVLPPADPTVLLTQLCVDGSDEVKIAAMSELSRYYSAYQKYVECVACASAVGSDVSGDAVGSVISDGGSEPSVNSSASTGRSARRRRWRRSRAAAKFSLTGSASSVSSEVSGFTVTSNQASKGESSCFNLLLKRDVQPSSAGTISFSELLDLPATDLRDRSELEPLHICRVGIGVYHVSTVGVPVLRCLAMVAADHVCLPGSIGEFVASASVRRMPGGPVSADRLGFPQPTVDTGYTHLLSLTRLDQDTLRILAEFLSRPGVKAGIMLPDISSLLTVCPPGHKRSELVSELVQAGYEADDIRAVLSHGLAFGLDVHELSSGAQALLQAMSVEKGANEISLAVGFRAVAFVVQTALFTAGVDSASYVFVDAGTKATPVSTAEVVNMPDPFLTTLGGEHWTGYETAVSRAVSELWQSGRSGPNVRRMVELRRAAISRLSVGELVVGVIAVDRFMFHNPGLTVVTLTRPDCLLWLPMKGVREVVTVVDTYDQQWLGSVGCAVVLVPDMVAPELSTVTVFDAAGRPGVSHNCEVGREKTARDALGIVQRHL